MHWRSGKEASPRSAGLRALAGPVCGLLVLLAGARAAAQAPAFPPAWQPPRGGSGSYYETSWRRLTAEPSPPPFARLVRAAAPTADGPLLGRDPAAAALEPPPGPATVIQCIALDGPAVVDDVPVFPIQLRRGGRNLPADGDETGEEGGPSFTIQLQPPGPERLFRLESEVHFMDRIRATTPRRPFEPVIFPEEPVISTSNEPPQRVWPPRREFAEPHYVCYDPLFFQQKYFERYGWDLGAVAPLVSLLTFWFDGVTFPYHLANAPCRGGECSAGYCLPGDPTPLRLDPPEWPVSVEVNYYRTGPAGDCGCATH
jgi:hypothetical protein